MRILQIANFVSPTSGGLRTSIDILRHGYEERGWTVGRITPYQELHRRGEISGISSVRIPTAGDYRVFLSRKAIIRAILDFRPDIIELSDKTTLAWLPKWCAQQSIACCVISHERLDFTLRHAKVFSGTLLRLAQRWTASVQKYSSRIICASDFASREFTVDDRRIEKIPFGVNVETIEPRLTREVGRPTYVISMCSRLSGEKRPELVIEALRVLAQRLDVHLRVMGDGPLRKHLEKMSVDLPIEFLGHISDRKKVFAELREADAVVNLGQFETFGLVTLEALATGTPVVVSNSGASPELVDDTCGRVVAPIPSLIAQALEDLLTLNDPALFSRCRDRAECFSWSLTIGAFCALYSEIVNLEPV